MNILLIHQYFLSENEPGGSRFNQFVKYWANMGHNVTVVAGTVNYSTGKKDEKYKGKWVIQERPSERVTIYRCYVSEGYNKSFLHRLWAYFSFTISSIWACLLRIPKQDIMIVTSPPLFVGITAILTYFFKRIPYVFEVRDLWPESAIDIGVLKNSMLIKLAYLVEKYSYKYAKKINVLTPAFRTILVEKKKVPPDKLVLIPNGADFDLFKPGPTNNWVRKHYNLQDKFVVAYLGAHGVANNLISLLRVAEACKDFEDIVFMLVGDGMEKEKLLSYAKEKGLSNVLFIPAQPKSKVADFCRAADVCTAVLKKVETFKTVYPNKVFDYMSCAKPILIGIDGVARELIEKSQCGFYVDPEDVEGFKKRILQLKANPNLASELGQNGLNFVRTHFSREQLAEKYEKVLLELVKKDNNK